MIDNLLDIAISVAKQSTMRKRYACIVIYQNQIISTGFNQKIGYTYERNKESSKTRKSYHAEIRALCRIKDQKILSKCTIYIIRIDRNDEVWDAIPCAHCSKYLQRKGIQGVYTLKK